MPTSEQPPSDQPTTMSLNDYYQQLSDLTNLPAEAFSQRADPPTKTTDPLLHAAQSKAQQAGRDINPEQTAEAKQAEALAELTNLKDYLVSCGVADEVIESRLRSDELDTFYDGETGEYYLAYEQDEPFELNLNDLNLTGTLPPLSYMRLSVLDCSFNQLTSLDNLPASLSVLRCYNNQLTSLDKLPDSLSVLDCYHNQLTSLDHLPDSLSTLRCYNNQLTSLDNLPDSLSVLDCSSNQLTSLDNLPDSLSTLYCLGNQLTSLDKLPDSLSVLDCRNNQLTSLDNLPDSLSVLRCSSNQLTEQQKRDIKKRFSFAVV